MKKAYVSHINVENVPEESRVTFHTILDKVVEVVEIVTDKVVEVRLVSLERNVHVSHINVENVPEVNHVTFLTMLNKVV